MSGQASLRAERPAKPAQGGPAGQLVAAFLASKEGRSRHTRATYASPLQGLFVPFCDREGVMTAADLTPDLVDRFEREVNRLTHVTKGTPLSPATRHTYLKGVRQLLSWLQQRHGEEVRPDLVNLPPLKKINREILTRDELQALEDAAPSERNRLIIRVLADTGMREGECASINLDDLIAKERSYYLAVRGKTVQGRMPPVDRGLYRRLKAYADRVRPREARTRRLFVADRRWAGEYRALTEDGVYHLVKDALDRMKFGRRAYPHLLRGSAISWMLKKGITPPMVSEITGASIQVIMRYYFHSTDEERFEALMRIRADD